MRHCDPDRLVMISTGDDRPDDLERTHLAACPDCTEQLAELSASVDLVRAGREMHLVAPPASVWDRIGSELGFEADAAGAPNRVAPQTPQTFDEAATATAPVPDTPLVPQLRRARTQSPRRRSARAGIRAALPLAAAALVVGIVAGVGGGIWWQSGQKPDATGPLSSSSVIATAQLAAFPQWPGASGVAIVEAQADGRRSVVVDVDTTVASTTGIREVWLIRTDGTGLISLGLLDGEDGIFPVPADIDLAQYALVDVSAESDDGDPAHSGDSIVRGALHQS